MTLAPFGGFSQPFGSPVESCWPRLQADLSSKLSQSELTNEFGDKGTKL